MSLTDWYSTKGHWINVHCVAQSQSHSNLYSEHTLASSRIKAVLSSVIQMNLDILLVLHSWPLKAPHQVGQHRSGLLMGIFLPLPFLCVLPGTSPWAIPYLCISTSRPTSFRATWSSTTPPTWQRANWRPWRLGWLPRKTSSSPCLHPAHSAGCSLRRWVSIFGSCCVCFSFTFNSRVWHCLQHNQSSIASVWKWVPLKL